MRKTIVFVLVACMVFAALSTVAMAKFDNENDPAWVCPIIDFNPFIFGLYRNTTAESTFKHDSFTPETGFIIAIAPVCF